MMDFPSIPGYRIERELGRGGMATVYLAHEEKLDRLVALKVLELYSSQGHELAERFIREARTAARLQHSNIISIFDVGQAGNLNYIAMEYLPGGTLRDVVRLGAMGAAEALTIIQQLGRALGYAHSQGYIHRDIKPENIMFRRDGTAMLTDFGIARAVGSATRLTKTGTSIGTPHYMSPEQARGLELDGRADLYSLGVVFYEMLTGRVPYDAEDSVAVAIKHIQEPVPELPPYLRRYQPLLDRLLAKARGDRAASGEEVFRLIGDIEGGGDRKRAAPLPGQYNRVADADEWGKLSVMPSAGVDPGSGKSTDVLAKGLPRKISQHQGGARFGVYVQKESKVSYLDKTSRRWLATVLLVTLVVTIAVLVGILSQTGMKRKAESMAGEVWREPLTGMEFVWIPAGKFMMGSNAGASDEKPIHGVRITEGFWLGKYEVTQGQWRAIMGSNPSYFQIGDNYPVEQLSWNDAQEFIKRLNSRIGLKFRLPTEAEWEYACRAGTTGERYGNFDSVAWYSANLGSATQPAGQKQPNAFGLYDMLGNVCEWVEDWYDSDYYVRSPVNDPPGPSSGSFRVYRGGSWLSSVQDIRVANRFFYTPSNRLNVLGFRLARTR